MNFAFVVVAGLVVGGVGSGIGGRVLGRGRAGCTARRSSRTAPHPVLATATGVSTKQSGLVGALLVPPVVVDLVHLHPPSPVGINHKDGSTTGALRYRPNEAVALAVLPGEFALGPIGRQAVRGKVLGNVVGHGIAATPVGAGSRGVEGVEGELMLGAGVGLTSGLEGPVCLEGGRGW